MIAAVYARRSTEQVNADPEAKSVARQIENARAFVIAKGWGVAEAHVYADDAVSGAETRKLVKRQRLIDTIERGAPPFQVLVMRDASRFSREDGDEAFTELKRLTKAGIAIWFYQEGTPFEYGNFAANITGIVRAEMNAEFRRQIGRWTREAMVRKAASGHHTGGRCFGYETVRVDGHAERRIDEAQAEVVRRIFSLCATGTGYTRIAKQLNAEQAPAPRPQQHRPAGWSPSTVNEVLHRDLYRGHVVWNKTKKRDAEGKTAPTARPASEWMHREDPSLRIVSDEMWTAAHARLRGVRAHLDTSHGGRHARDIDSKYLLSGFARCAQCGGSLTVLSRRHGSRRARFYGCLAHDKRGRHVCSNSLVLPMARVDEAVLGALIKGSLRPAVVRAILDAVFAAMRPKAVATNTRALKHELRALDEKIARLTVAIEDGGVLAPIVAQLQKRQAEREALLGSIAASEATKQLEIDQAEIERQVLAKVDGWRERLVANGRQVLREILDGHFRFTPVGRAYHFEADLTIGALIAGLVGTPIFLASPKGIAKGGNGGVVLPRCAGIAA